jgi:hypothetical protein
MRRTYSSCSLGNSRVLLIIPYLNKSQDFGFHPMLSSTSYENLSAPFFAIVNIVLNITLSKENISHNE